mmetsp:Transcript_94094/g.303993  ORF Transcript_94094/g.303993 Transcript_94094/m.303993 type:complete len:263 (-) Transcript_94094:34-822(-)
MTAGHDPVELVLTEVPHQGPQAGIRQQCPPEEGPLCLRQQGRPRLLGLELGLGLCALVHSQAPLETQLVPQAETLEVSALQRPDAHLVQGPHGGVPGSAMQEAGLTSMLAAAQHAHPHWLRHCPMRRPEHCQLGSATVDNEELATGISLADDHVPWPIFGAGEGSYELRVLGRREVREERHLGDQGKALHEERAPCALLCDGLHPAPLRASALRVVHPVGPGADGSHKSISCTRGHQFHHRWKCAGALVTRRPHGRCPFFWH